ncbi:MAG TPA: dephospho-CoA kinase [Tepidisphaeraceae bacterium]|jgi:dephospho-CoA kinase|nr:dephospho-CoA kinase [Tepidisphaeraceae bacterium]
MYAGKPIIGIAGGIGSGKSFIARLFAEAGCRVIDSDAQVRRVYEDPAVIETLKQWWGPGVLKTDGTVDRGFIARTIFGDAQQRVRLEQFLHPLVNAAREREMKEYARDDSVLAFVWDTPLLFETGLAGGCDFVVFVDSPPDLRLKRVCETRRWNPDELQRRENLQWPLDKKRKISDYVLSNTADAALARDQVRDLIPRILAQVAKQSAATGRR